MCVGGGVLTVLGVISQGGFSISDCIAISSIPRGVSVLCLGTLEQNSQLSLLAQEKRKRVERAAVECLPSMLEVLGSTLRHSRARSSPCLQRSFSSSFCACEHLPLG
jgi:hypothetical protein